MEGIKESEVVAKTMEKFITFSIGHLKFKDSNIELEIPTDPDLHMFFDRSLIGGISIVSNHYAKANNPRLETNDPKQKTSYFGFFDRNNQYGDAMRQYLLTGGFQWMELKTTSPEFWYEFALHQKEEQEHGYMFEVDIIYPEELHDSHDNFPLV